jgi:pimeloyl-ACP methyl ester carboxylesterase
VQKITVKTTAGENLAAYLFEPAGAMRYMMIIAHGFRGAKENGGRVFGFASQVNKLNIGVVAFDFRGSGESQGNFGDITLSRQASDLATVIAYTSDRFNLPLILLGRSFGGSTVLAGGAGDARVAGYILWSTPVLMKQTFARVIPDGYHKMKTGQPIEDETGQYLLKPDLIEDFARHDMDSYLQAVGDRPVLIVQASDDEIVDPANASYMQERLKNSTLIMVDHSGHRFINNTACREQITIDWLKKHFT